MCRRAGKKEAAVSIQRQRSGSAGHAIAGADGDCSSSTSSRLAARARRCAKPANAAKQSPTPLPHPVQAPYGRWDRGHTAGSRLRGGRGCARPVGPCRRGQGGARSLQTSQRSPVGPALTCSSVGSGQAVRMARQRHCRSSAGASRAAHRAPHPPPPPHPQSVQRWGRTQSLWLRFAVAPPTVGAPHGITACLLLRSGPHDLAVIEATRPGAQHFACTAARGCCCSRCRCKLRSCMPSASSPGSLNTHFRQPGPNFHQLTHC